MKPTDEEIRVAIYATKTQHRGICHDMADELLRLRALIPEVIERLEAVRDNTSFVDIDALDAIIADVRRWVAS